MDKAKNEVLTKLEILSLVEETRGMFEGGVSMADELQLERRRDDARSRLREITWDAE